jgi:RimJ/RimL family protein N-acetyltransferase
VRLERYTGGNADFDKAIVDLHNRSYRRMRLTPPADLEYLWKTWPGLSAHEFVLAWEGERMVGYAEWIVANDKPLMNSLVAARSHWGTPVAAAAGTQAMEYMLALGYRTLYSSVISKNAASIKLQQRHGWRLTTELARTYVRRFGATAV